MKILFVDSGFPMFDRSSAGLRMFQILKLLIVAGHQCTYYAFNRDGQEQVIGQSQLGRYTQTLEKLGVVTISRIGFEAVLEVSNFDVVYFNYFYAAEHRIQTVRLWQPTARLVIDSVDLVHKRLSLKAILSGRQEDRVAAETIKDRELRTYLAADLTIAITDEEAEELSRENNKIRTHVIPNIHEVSPRDRVENATPTILFVGVFSHEPNVDAVLYFARDVWPKIQMEIPESRWLIVGGNPPPEVSSLASENIKVLGYVPETLPYLKESWVSVAPLRFGAGMKGKVGEAMAAGLPVVTTSIGIQGCSFSPGKHLVVGDDAETFAEQVIRLIKDRNLRHRIGLEGQQFVRANYSPEVVGQSVISLLCKLAELPDRKSTPLRTLQLASRVSKKFLDRHLLWRLKNTRMRYACKNLDS